MLTDHDNERSGGGATVTRDRKEFDKAEDVVASFSQDFSLSLELSVDIIEIASCKFCEQIDPQEIRVCYSPACNGVFLNLTNES